MASVRIRSRLRQLRDWAGGSPPFTPGHVVTVQPDGETFAPEAPTGGGGGGAPDDAGYLVTASDPDLTNETVVGATPGGELGGTWPAPTVDTVHSGSSHAQAQAAAEATAAAALAGHVAAGDPHPGYRLESAPITSADIQDGTIATGDLAFDPATQAELDAHLNDATDAHDASAISFAPGGGLAADDVQEALLELDTEKAASVHTHAGEDIASGTVADARIAASIARDSEVSAAIAASEAGQVRDGDAAGGALDGTYPNPGIAASVAGAGLAESANVLAVNVDDSTIEIAADTLRVKDGGITAAKVAADVATQAELDAHVSDSSDAHDASAISVVSTTLSGTGTDVQAVFEEIDNLLDDHSSRHENGGADEMSIAGLDGMPTELTNHLNDSSDAHDASAISVLDVAGDYTATDVEGVLAEIAPQLGGGGGDLVLIERQLLGSADDFDFQSIPDDYEDLVLVFQCRATNTSAVNIGIRFNNDSGANYDFAEGGGAVAGQTSGRCASAAGAGNGASRSGWGTIEIQNYKRTTFFKTYHSLGGRSEDASAEQHARYYAGTWRDTSAITRVTLVPSAGTTFVVGSVATLYGRGVT